MMSDVYSFVFRGDLALQAIEATGLALPSIGVEEGFEQISAALSLELLDAVDIQNARRMALVYVTITAFERGARTFVRRVLIDEFEDDWWTKGVSNKIRTFAESRRDEEVKTKWHGDRGDDLLDYTELGHLADVCQQNWQVFEPYIQRIDWVRALFGSIERSRNVIMHSGQLTIEDIERVGVNIRDWSRQVGS